jgi:hypothetical protein
LVKKSIQQRSSIAGIATVIQASLTVDSVELSRETLRNHIPITVMGKNIEVASLPACHSMLSNLLWQKAKGGATH